jgi:hypothetical protein
MAFLAIDMILLCFLTMITVYPSLANSGYLDITTVKKFISWLIAKLIFIQSVLTDFRYETENSFSGVLLGK